MNRFQSSPPRLVTAVAAVAMTAITFGLFIILPAMIQSDGELSRVQAANVDTPIAAEAGAG